MQPQIENEERESLARGIEILPQHMQDGVRLYLDKGVKPGSFLTAVLSNNLVEAFKTADVTNIMNMQRWATWLYNDCPVGAWGSLDKVESWIRAQSE